MVVSSRHGFDCLSNSDKKINAYREDVKRNSTQVPGSCSKTSTNTRLVIEMWSCRAKENKLTKPQRRDICVLSDVTFKTDQERMCQYKAISLTR